MIGVRVTQNKLLFPFVFVMIPYLEFINTEGAILNPITKLQEPPMKEDCGMQARDMEGAEEAPDIFQKLGMIIQELIATMIAPGRKTKFVDNG
jgi:hypothetical protein